MMTGPQRKLVTIRIIVLLLVALLFLIARLVRFVHAQTPTAAEISKKETVATAFQPPQPAQIDAIPVRSALAFF